MVNTGTFNSNIVIILVLLMLLPVFIFMLTQGLFLFIQLIFLCIPKQYQEINNDPILCLTTDTEQQFENITFEDIKIATLRKAANGDKAARDWAMKYVFDVQPNDKAVDAKKYNTDQSIIDDAIEAMVAVKVKRKDAVQKIKSLVAKKDYKNVSDLFVDAISFN